MPEAAARSFPYGTPRAFEAALTARFKTLAADSPHVRPDYLVYPLADSVADKVCAILERHQDRPSTRFRDLVDLVLVARSRELNALHLRIALVSEHRRRALPEAGEFDVPDRALWEAGYARAASRAPGLDGFRTLAPAVTLSKAFVDPVLTAERTTGTWDPAAACWTR